MHWPRPYWCPLSAVAGRWSEWINSFWKGRPCVGIQLSKELIPNSDGGRRWNGLIDRSVTRICSEVGDRKKVGGLVGLNIFGHQEGKEHQLTRILIQPQLLSKFKPKKMQVLRYYIFSFSNWHWTPWSISLIQSTRERKFFCNFKLFRPLWQLLHSLRTNLRRKLGECTIILYQLSQKTGLVWITVNANNKKLCKKCSHGKIIIEY